MQTKNDRQLKLGAALSYASMIIGYVVQIAYTPLMIRIIGQVQYGVYNLTNSIVSYLSLFSAAFAPAYVRFYMRHKVKDGQRAIARMNGMFMLVFILLGFLTVVCGVFLVKDTNAILGSKFARSELKLAKFLMLLMVFNIAISFPLIPVVSFIQANERFVFQNGLNIIRQILNPFLSLPLLLMGFGSIGMVAATTIISMIISIWQIFFAVKVLKFDMDFKELDFQELKDVTVFSSYIFLNAVTDQINWNADKFIVGRFQGAIAVAVYGIAAQLNSYYLNLSTAISSVFIPRVNRLVAEAHDDLSLELTNIFIKIGRLQFMIIGFILSEIIVVGREFLGFWAGHDYYNAYPILLILVIPVTIPLIQNVGIAIQQAMNFHVFRSLLYFFIALANIGVSIILVRFYGGVGAASATAMALIIGNGFLMNWYYQAKIHLDVVKFWKTMAKNFPSIIGSVCVGFAIKSVINSYAILGFLMVALSVAFIYFSILFIFVLSSDERQIVKNKVSRHG